MRQSLLVVGLIMGCNGDTKDTGAGVAMELLTRLESAGPYSVGYRVTEIGYTSSEGARMLRLAVWYPSNDRDGTHPRYNGLIESQVALLNAELAGGEGFPVHVFSHGHQAYAEASGFFMEHLASHGFVVVAPDHTGNTTFDGAERATEIYALRSEDLGACLDALDGADSDLSFLAGRLETTAGVTASGHSFGGYTLHNLAGASFDRDLIARCLDGSDTSSFCSTMDEARANTFEAGLADSRFEAFVSMAPGDFRLYGTAGLAMVDRPILHMTGALDPQTGGDAEDIWSALAGGMHRRVDIDGGGHQTFTDFSGVLETFDGLIDADVGARIVNVYGLGWVLHQRGDLDASALFDGSLQVDDAVTLAQ